MPNISDIIRTASEAMRAFKEPTGLPPIEARGTPKLPVLLERARAKGVPVTSRAPGVPFHGAPETEQAVRTTAKPRLENPVATLKLLAKSFVDRDPELTTSVLRDNDLSTKMYEGAWRAEAAPHIADRDIAALLSPMKNDPVNQFQLLNDYFITMDELSQATKRKSDKIYDVGIDIWQKSADMLQKKVEADPQVAEAVRNVRDHVDSQWQELVDLGWIDPKRRLENYTPLRRINAMFEGMAQFTGEDPQALKMRVLSQQKRRTVSFGPRETDLISLLRQHRTEFLAKRAKHEAFLDFVTDPTLNFTEQMIGKELPEDLAVYRPGAGAFGSTAKTADGKFLNAYLKAVDPEGKYAVGGYVFPKKLVSALNEFDARNLVGTEATVARAQGALGKWLTVYNPVNTNVNRGGDLFVAMFYPETGKAQPLGILKWYGKATKIAYDTAFGKQRHIVELHGKKVDIGDLAVREGLTTGTIQHQVGGELMPTDFLQYTPEARDLHQKWFQNILGFFEADRLATELSPRIAAGLEAVERTGDWSQFGKVGREITFRYGAGGPRLTKLPLVKAMAPFLMYQGLATQRFLHTLGAKGLEPKARLAIGLIAIPWAINKWNNQNDNYRQAELSLPDYERNQMHIWMPDFIDPSKPKLAVDGSPVCLRFRLNMPDQVAAFIGLGNLAPRAERVFTGRDTPMQFAKESIKMAGESISGTLVYPQIVQQLMGANSITGKPIEGVSGRVERVAPLARLGATTYRTYKNYGLSEATLKFISEITGMRAANTMHRGTGLYDAQFMEARRAHEDAKARLERYKKTDPDKAEQALRDVYTTADELNRLAAVIQKEREQGYTPPNPRNEPIKSVEVNKRRLPELVKEIENERGNQ